MSMQTNTPIPFFLDLTTAQMLKMINTTNKIIEERNN